MQEWLINLTVHHQYLVYGIVIFVSFVEGPILAMLCGLLLRLNYFEFMAIYAALMIGDLVGDVFWYFVGYYAGHRFIKRFGKYFSITEDGVAAVTRIFHAYKDRILLISKITMGLGFALVTLITAGMVKIPFGRYMALNVGGQFVWTGILLAIGYFLGNLYLTINGVLGKISIATIIIVIFFGLVGYGKYVRAHMLKSRLL